jgi:hypothetical protein
MHDDQPIFQDVGHALHVSYLVHGQPATRPSPTGALIDQLVKQNHVWDGIPAPRESRVNFRGLDPLEVRGQCAQVVGMCDRLLHPAELAAVRAIYGWQLEKSKGVRGMVEYCRPMLGDLSEDCGLYLGWHVYGTQDQRKGISIGAIADKFGRTTQALTYAASLLRKSGQTYHKRACDSLWGRFADGGLVPLF